MALLTRTCPTFCNVTLCGPATKNLVKILIPIEVTRAENQIYMYCCYILVILVMLKRQFSETLNIMSIQRMNVSAYFSLCFVRRWFIDRAIEPINIVLLLFLLLIVSRLNLSICISDFRVL